MRASRSAEPTHLSGHLSASFKRPALQASRGLTATPDCCPTAAHPQNETILRSPALLGIAAPPHRCRWPREDRPPNRLQKSLLSPLSPLSPSDHGKFLTGWSGASKVTSGGSIPVVCRLGSISGGSFGSSTELEKNVQILGTISTW